MLIAQRSDRQINLFGQLIFVALQMGAVRNRIIERLSRGFRIPPGQSRAAAIAGDGQQPRFEFPFGIPTVQVFENSHKGFLNGVLRILAMSEHAKAKPKDLALKSTNQVLERDRLARDTIAD